MKNIGRVISSNRTVRMHADGQSMVEFALVLPLLVLIMAGIFDLGRAFFASITITNAARVGARYGTLHLNDSQGTCDSTKFEATSSGIIIDYSNITITCSTTITCAAPVPGPMTTTAGCTSSNPITVTVNYLYDDMILKFFFPGEGIPMHRQEVMLVP